MVKEPLFVIKLLIGFFLMIFLLWTKMIFLTQCVVATDLNSSVTLIYAVSKF